MMSKISDEFNPCSKNRKEDYDLIHLLTLNGAKDAAIDKRFCPNIL